MIPDDEPWWMVRRSMQGDGSVATAAAIGDRYMADKVCHGTCPLAAERQQAIKDERQQAIKAEPASETLRALDTLPFRPIGYEW